MSSLVGNDHRIEDSFDNFDDYELSSQQSDTEGESPRVIIIIINYVMSQYPTSYNSVFRIISMLTLEILFR